MKLKWLSTIGLTLIMLAAVVAAAGAQQFTTTQLGTLGGSDSYAAAVSSAGHVVGKSKRADGQMRAFIYYGGFGGMMELPAPDGETGANGVNIQGTAVGYIMVAGHSNAVVWGMDGMLDLPNLLGGTESAATHINDVGLIVGWAADNAGVRYPMRWSANGSDGQTLGGPGMPVAVNRKGEVVGNGPSTGENTAFYWNDQQGMFNIKTNEGVSAGIFVAAINDAGMVVGRTEHQGVTREFLWHQAMGMANLFPGGSAQITAINNNGDMAGTMLESGMDFTFRYLQAMGPQILMKSGSYARAIDEAGTVYGLLTRFGGGDAFVWNGGDQLSLTPPNGVGSDIRYLRGTFGAGEVLTIDNQTIATMWTFDNTPPPPPPPPPPPVDVTVTVTAPPIVAAFELTGAPLYFDVVASHGTPVCTVKNMPFASGDLMRIGTNLIDCSSKDPSSGSMGFASAEVIVVLQGPGGDQGPMGPAGPKGDKGDKGDKGADGTNGANGANGADGAKGADGANGADGAKGDKGDQGNAGADGVAGAPGTAGANGEAGVAGAAGPQGPEGPQGLTGADGTKGDTGAAGADGAKGDTGAAGAPGAAGAQGPAGVAGASGATGADGAKGDIGVTGATGPKGEGLVTGSLLLMPNNVQAPAGYVRIGSYTQDKVNTSGLVTSKQTVSITIVIWQKQ